MESLHSTPLVGQECSSNCLAINQFNPNSVFTGGEDGSICVVSTEHGNLVNKIGGCGLLIVIVVSFYLIVWAKHNYMYMYMYVHVHSI